MLNVAYPFAPVGPDTVGGAEQILSLLDVALTEAGHRSVVIARSDSQVAGTLIPLPRCRGLITEPIRYQIHQRCRAAILDAVAAYRCDLVHFHGLDFPDYLPMLKVPMLATLHLPIHWYSPAVFRTLPDNVWLNCVSEHQLSCAPRSLRMVGAIPNGVVLEQFAFHCRKRNYALAIGRICPEKNLHVALEAGTMADLPVLIGGQVYAYAEHQAYFAEQIASRLQPPHRFLGPLDIVRKKRLLAGARCVLIPSLAETSSLVAMEAAAAGTPVIAFDSGALPEIIQHGQTGYIVRDVASMARAIKQLNVLDPSLCRTIAGQRFSHDRMIAGYFRLYTHLIGGSHGTISQPLDAASLHR